MMGNVGQITENLVVMKDRTDQCDVIEVHGGARRPSMGH
jgi:hypothetical protein